MILVDSTDAVGGDLALAKFKHGKKTTEEATDVRMDAAILESEAACCFFSEVGSSLSFIHPPPDKSQCNNCRSKTERV